MIPKNDQREPTLTLEKKRDEEQNTMLYKKKKKDKKGKVYVKFVKNNGDAIHIKLQIVCSKFPKPKKVAFDFRQTQQKPFSVAKEMASHFKLPPQFTTKVEEAIKRAVTKANEMAQQHTSPHKPSSQSIAIEEAPSRAAGNLNGLSVMDTLASPSSLYLPHSTDSKEEWMNSDLTAAKHKPSVVTPDVTCTWARDRPKSVSRIRRRSLDIMLDAFNSSISPSTETLAFTRTFSERAPQPSTTSFTPEPPRQPHSNPRSKQMHTSNPHISDPNVMIDDQDDEEQVQYEANHKTNMFVPLHHFTPQTLCFHIKQWVLADEDYQNNLSEIKRKFVQRDLHGRMICTQPMNNTKDMMEKDLLSTSLVTPKTFDIIMTYCKECKDTNINSLESKSPQEIAHVLFSYPLDRLLERIISQPIDGKRFIQSVIAPNDDIIAAETGWDEEEVYQIQSMLFRHHTFTKSQFEQNMNDILAKKYAATLSEDIRDAIKGVMSQHNVDEVHYRIKNALSIDEFADSVMNMVDEWTQKDENEWIVMQIYHVIAQCFVFDASNDLLLALQHWICNNCGNCNVNSCVNSSFTTGVTMCTMCGMHQVNQIILKLRHHDSYTMVNDVSKSYCATDSKESESDDKSIDKLIEEAINNDGLFNLLCPNKHHKHPCVSTLRLANKLIQYKRWLHTIYKEKGSDCIGETVKVDIAKIMDPNIFKNTFMQCIKDIESITDDNLRSITQLMQRNIQNIFDINMFVNSNQNNQKTFSETLRKYTKISDASCSNLYRVISKAIQAIAKTTPVDHNVLKETFLEQAALIHNQTELLKQMFEYNTDNIADIRLFAKIKPLAFGKLIRENTAIRVPTGVKLYRSIKEPLKQRAQREQFGQFLSDLDIVTIHKDYHHILDVHINHGNKETMMNVFRFFNLVVHYR
eukprot:722370_1